MKIIFDNNESAAPLAPLLHEKQEEVNELLDAIEEILSQAEERLEGQGETSA